MRIKNLFLAAVLFAVSAAALVGCKVGGEVDPDGVTSGVPAAR